QQASLAILTTAAGMVALIIWLPHSPIARRLAVMGAIDGRVSPALGQTPESTDVHYAICHTDLRPGGQVRMGEHIRSASLKHGGYLAKGSRVQVVGMRFGEVLVEPADDDEEEQA
ncbi:MAG: hypothetical protein ACOCXA_06020, partial [Planctomycetota bacterium]